MDFKTFASDDNYFTINLPIDWEEYDDAKNAYAFFNAKSWTGNFRITPFRQTVIRSNTENKALKLINEEFEEIDGAIKLRYNEFDCVYYKKDIEQDSEQFVIYYWMIGKGNDVFVCSFTINKDQEKTKQNEQELQTVQNILKSIKIIV